MKSLPPRQDASGMEPRQHSGAIAKLAAAPSDQARQAVICRGRNGGRGGKTPARHLRKAWRKTVEAVRDRAFTLLAAVEWGRSSKEEAEGEEDETPGNHPFAAAFPNVCASTRGTQNPVCKTQGRPQPPPEP